MVVSKFNINGVIKDGKELNYTDLKVLTQQFINKNNHFPVQSECIMSNNLPQTRIINKILKDNKITFNDFCNYFGKVKHVRTESKDFDLYLKKYKSKCNELGRALKLSELVNNSFGLPSGKWFIDNCPDDIKSYDEFIEWCGFKSNKLKKDKNFVIEKLIELQNKLHREIIVSDINESNLGFSMIAVTRIFGGLGKAKEEIGLINSQRIINKSQTFSELKNDLKIILLSIKEKEGRNQIILKDISQTKYVEYPSCATRYKNQFEKHNEDFYKFVESYGLKFATNGNGNCFKFDDGEFTKSFLEYKLSCYLKNELGLIYNQDYFRDVRYDTFSDTDRKINCDYLIKHNGKQYYVEISGMIKPCYKDKWKETDFKSHTKNEYRDNMILKERLFKDNNCSYFIWFSDDIHNEIYRDVFKKL